MVLYLYTLFFPNMNVSICMIIICVLSHIDLHMCPSQGWNPTACTAGGPTPAPSRLKQTCRSAFKSSSASLDTQRYIWIDSYVCMCMSIRITCMYIHLYVYLQHMYVWISICMCIYVPVCACISICMYVHIYACMCIYIHVNPVCACIFMYIHMYIYMYL
jgi:hypothetical protein